MGEPIHKRAIKKVGWWAAELLLARLCMRLLRSQFEPVGRGLMKVLRMRWNDRRVRPEQAMVPAKPLPKGPFRVSRPGHVGDLLLWVPRGIDSFLIDELTGGYGYSHATVDTGEIDIPTGKPVMAEITIGQTVTHKFQDQYGKRPYARVPLSQAGVDVQQLAACTNSKMGEKYDTLDALTLGEIQDPVKEVCSGLIADCLPDEELRQIARSKRVGLLHRGSVSIHSSLDAEKLRAFVSPNGLAEFYGAPKGRKVRRPNTLVEPKPVTSSVTRVARQATRRQGWKVAGAALSAALVGLVVSRARRSR